VSSLPGASPQKVERLLTDPLETAIREVKDVEEVFSSSSFGTSFLLVRIERHAPTERRLGEVREKVRQARELLPAKASLPEVDTSLLRTYAMVMTLSAGRASVGELRGQARALARDLEAVPAVRRVNLVGLPAEEVEVAVDLLRLARRAIPLDRVVDAVARHNVRLPSGELQVGSVRAGIHTTGAYRRLEDVESTFVPAGDRGLPVTVDSIAKVRRGPAPADVAVRAGRDRAVALAVDIFGDSNAPAVGRRLRRLVAERSEHLGRDMEIAIVADEPLHVDARLSKLYGSLALGLVLVAGLTLLGLGWRLGLAVTASIPLAFLLSLAFMAFTRHPLHQISIAALVMAIGIVVDESIVVTDSIQRHLDRRVGAVRAAVDGLAEVHLPILAGAATTIAAFAPLAAMKGDIGDFIRSIPIVVSVMIVGSVLVASFAIPPLSVLVQRRSSGPRPGGSMQRLERLHRPVLAHALRSPRAVVAAFVLLVLAAGVCVRQLLWPPTLFPDADRRQFLVYVELPQEAPLTRTLEVLDEVETVLADEPVVSQWVSFVGRAAPKFYYNQFDVARGENLAQVIVNLGSGSRSENVRAIAGRVQDRLRQGVAGAMVRAEFLRQGYASGDAIDLFIMGDDLETLQKAAARAREIVKSVPGVTNVRDSFGYDPVTIRAEVQRAHTGVLGVSHEEVGGVLRRAIDGVVATRYREEDDEIPVRIRLRSEHRSDLSVLRSLPVWSERLARPVPLAHVASLVPGFATRTILRYNGRREAHVRADILPGHPQVRVADEVERRIRGGLTLREGYAMEFHGQRRDLAESFRAMGRAGLASLVLIYVVLFLRFRALAQPLVILLAVPMAFVGATLGLVATGSSLSFMAALGFVSLSGVTVNDSIVLVDRINRLRDEGADLRESVLAGVASRVRPIVLTSLTTIGGLVPLTLGGGSFWRPFGSVVVFGMAASTVLTLIVQPCAYWLVAARSRRA